MTELEIDGKTFRTNKKMGAMEQFKLAKRLVPIFDLFFQNKDKLQAGGQTQAFNLLITAFAQAIAKIPDDDCDYIINKCLALVQVKQEQAWISVWNETAKQLQFSDITMPIMIHLTLMVIQDNLADFMPAPPLNG